MNETFVTFHGWVGSVRHRLHKDVPVATLRVGVTPRIRRDGDWVDGETTWYSVTAWRGLADNIRDSVRKGDAVVVHGRLRTETWSPDQGAPSTTLHVDASLVGHDLTRGRSAFFRPARQEPTGERADEHHGAENDEQVAPAIEAAGTVEGGAAAEGPAARVGMPPEYAA